MTRRSRNAVQIVSILVMFAASLQGTSLTGRAQSPDDRTRKLYFIMGAVKNPGAYEVEGRVSLLKLVARAGGLTGNHGTVAFMMRERKLSAPARSEDNRGPEYQITQVNINAMSKPIEPLDLEPGDIVNVPPTDVVQVAGEVISPGSFPFKEGITLLQAISLAHGLRERVKTGKAVIFRQDASTGSRQEIKVDLDAVRSGKLKDVPLRPNDIVVVPNESASQPRFLDAPPIPGLTPCRGRGSRPCIAQSDLFDSASQRH